MTTIQLISVILMFKLKCKDECRSNPIRVYNVLAFLMKLRCLLCERKIYMKIDTFQISHEAIKHILGIGRTPPLTGDR